MKHLSDIANLIMLEVKNEEHTNLLKDVEEECYPQLGRILFDLIARDFEFLLEVLSCFYSHHYLYPLLTHLLNCMGQAEPELKVEFKKYVLRIIRELNSSPQRTVIRQPIISARFNHPNMWEKWNRLSRVCTLEYLVSNKLSRLKAAMDYILAIDTAWFIELLDSLTIDYDSTCILYMLHDAAKFDLLLTAISSSSLEQRDWYCTVLIGSAVENEISSQEIEDMINRNAEKLDNFALAFFTSPLPHSTITSVLWEPMTKIFAKKAMLKKVLAEPLGVTNLLSCLYMHEHLSENEYSEFADDHVCALLTWLDMNPSDFFLNQDSHVDYYFGLINGIVDQLCQCSVPWGAQIKRAISFNTVDYYGWQPEWDSGKNHDRLLVPLCAIFSCAATRLYVDTKDIRYLNCMRWLLTHLAEWVPESLQQRLDQSLGVNLFNLLGYFQTGLEREVCDLLDVIISVMDYTAFASAYLSAEHPSEIVVNHINQTWQWKKLLVDNGEEEEVKAGKRMDEALLASAHSSLGD